MSRVEVVDAGVQCTVQDLRGRPGYWGVGVPPSGAWDGTSLFLGNLAVGNDRSAAGLEWVVTGPTLRFTDRRLVCVTGAATQASLDGRPLRPGHVELARAGSLLVTGGTGEHGMRGYLAVSGGIDVPPDLGSRSTFLLGAIGGYDGRAIAPGDLLPLGRTENCGPPMNVATALPRLGNDWELRVLPGPHGAPDHLTEEGVEELFGSTWTVDHRADRTGIRLLGPQPRWARSDGGEAGLHPSNIHDSAYPVGGLMLSGDTPVIVGPDGPSLGGFVVPAAVVSADHWKLGQLRPGDTVRLVRVDHEEAERTARAAARRLDLAGEAALQEPDRFPARRATGVRRLEPLVDCKVARSGLAVTVRSSGDRHLLVEAGDPVLDLGVRVWIGLLEKALVSAAVDGVRELVAGVRSLLVGYDPSVVTAQELARVIEEQLDGLDDPMTTTIPCREVVLPIAFDHPLAHEAMARYARSVRPDAPWCPDNVEFIRRVNDLDARDDVFDIVSAATYLVLGLGDVYLGAPVAVPIDPRHRLVTTKYNPARTWTPQNAVGIGGVYLCVYGMEGPGGYQLVGRTVPVWRHHAADEKPWLLRHFDRLRFRPVSAEELSDHRADIEAGRADLDTRPATFAMAEVAALEAAHGAEIAATAHRRSAAFHAERLRWKEAR